MKRLLVVFLLLLEPIQCGGDTEEMYRELLAEIESGEVALSSLPDEPSSTMDMVLTCATGEEVGQTMTCDVQGCTEEACFIWSSVDTGIVYKRCEKHTYDNSMKG